MDNETQNILKILGVAVLVLFVLKPKKKRKKDTLDTSLGEGTASESLSEISDEMFENGKISIKAFRSAINNGESNEQLESLNRITLKDYGIKVFKCQKSGKLTARNSKGQDIAKEE